MDAIDIIAATLRRYLEIAVFLSLGLVTSSDALARSRRGSRRL